jgi:hypothetical protein
MNYLITAPIPPGTRGVLAVNLGRILSVLLESGQLLKAFDPPDQPTSEELAALGSLLNGEIATGAFGGSMRKLIHYYQIQQGLGDQFGGFVEETTARSLNDMVRACQMPLSNAPLPDLRTLSEFGITFSNATRKFHLHFWLEGDAQERTLSVTPTVLPALLAMKSSAAHFVFDVKANSFIARDNLLP